MSEIDFQWGESVFRSARAMEAQMRPDSSRWRTSVSRSSESVVPAVADRVEATRSVAVAAASPAGIIGAQ